MASISEVLDLNGTLGSLQIGMYNFVNNAIIGCLWVLDTLHQIFVCHMAYTYMVTDFGNLIAITQETWSINAMIIVTASMDLGSRILFSLRIWQFGKKQWFPAGIILILSLGEFIPAVENLKYIFNYLLHILYYQYGQFSFAFMADFLIAASQITLLLKQHSKVSSINTCILAAIWELLLSFFFYQPLHGNNGLMIIGLSGIAPIISSTFPNIEPSSNGQEIIHITNAIKSECLNQVV
ncbi:hypothetical protein OBBRIDRAFT_807350 [Obba rivulosa]|uniref:Uncharacterized protein n=1 Tax=Obba rivulosa TaxID=1052685 RepID=A0A8E2DKC9_9APHY|nr:hypothetical protein OBBRIDRAFT_807350 [Obba rivulosa]